VAKAVSGRRVAKSPMTLSVVVISRPLLLVHFHAFLIFNISLMSCSVHAVYLVVHWQLYERTS